MQIRSFVSRRFGVALMACTVLGLAGALAGCSGSHQKSITLYSGQHAQMVRLLVSEFEKQTGIKVKVREGGGPELAHQIEKEGQQTPADVLFTENSPALIYLQNKGLLTDIDKATLQAVPAKYNSAQGQWVGVLARENVLTYNPKMVDASALPDSILGLAKPQWQGMVGVHLTSPDFMPVIKTIALQKGRDAALHWLEGIKRNAKLYQHSSGLVNAVNHGDVAIGISNSYYWYRLREQVGDKDMVSRVRHFSNGDPGGLINISGAAIMKYAPHPQRAQKFVAFMVSEQAQQMLAQSKVDFEYPLRAGVAASPQLKPLDTLQPPDVTPQQLGTDADVLKMLQEAGLL